MNRIIITLADLPLKNRYIALSDGRNAALYKRFCLIFYIRTSKVYQDHHIFTTLITLADTLNLKFKKRYKWR